MIGKFQHILLTVILGLLIGCSPLKDESPVPGSFPVHNQAVQGTVLGAAAGAVYGSAAEISVPASAVVGGVVGGIIGSSEQKRVLKEHGVQVIQVGDQVTIILPADKFFEPGSSTLLPEADSALNNVALTLRSYGRAPITITGHTDSQSGSKDRQHWLSKAQAQAIASYLWSRGISAEHLIVVGAGSEDPISTQLTLHGRAQNRRIEITL